MVNNLELLKEHVPIKIKLNFSIAGLAHGLMSGLVFANLTFFYQNKLAADPILISTAWLIFAFWNTINDPIASYFIDNTRTRIGRRIPFIRYGSFFYGLAFIFCWFPITPLDSQIGLFFNFLAALFILDTMYTIVGACFFSLPNEIAVTAKQRASLSVYTTFFGFINLILGLVLPIILLTGQEGIHPLFIPIIIVIGILGSLVLFLTSFGIKENLFAQLQDHEGFIEGIKLTLKNKPFWILMIPAFFMQIISQVTSTGLLYYIEYVNQTPIYVIITFLLGIITGTIINLKKIIKWQPKKTGIYNLIILAAGVTGLFFFGTNPIISAIPFFLIGFGYIGIFITTPVLMGDVIDYDELITGKRREAIYGGVNAVVTKPAISIANSTFLGIITSFGFVINQPQSDSGLLGILVAFCLLPALLLIISAVALYWYPLDGSEWLKKKQIILDLHKEKEKKYLQSLSEGSRE
ncbi:MAG: MFS transporter [Candidatus Lokiarchaeota archaeon]|nr:MFS transporter [Candidatus Lokiarchaeota archaeon]